MPDLNQPPPGSGGGFAAVVFSGDFERVHYALVMAAAACAIDKPATLFFTMGAARALLGPSPDGTPAWRALPGGASFPGLTGGAVDNGFKARKVADFEDLLQSCVALGCRFMVCDMGLRALGLEGAAMREDVPIVGGGMATFLMDAPDGGHLVFV